MSIVQQTEASLAQEYLENNPGLTELEAIFLANSTIFLADFWASRVTLLQEGLSSFIQGVKKISEGYFMKSFRLFLEDFDRALMQNASVRKRYKVVRTQSRTLETSLGTLTYKRRYYRNRLTKEYVYLLDDLLQILPRSRVTQELQVELFEAASKHSYRESCEIACQGRISPTTCKNLFHKVVIPENLVAFPDLPSPEVLHIHADEDHVARQDQDYSSEVRMVVITTGAGRKGKKSVLQNKHYVFTADESPEDFWRRVREAIDEIYGEGERKIYLHGDGAAWIKRGLRELKVSKWVLDRFHLTQYLKKLSRGDGKVYQALMSFVMQKDKTGMTLYLDELSKTTTASPEDFQKWRTYVLGNWTGAMTAYHDPDAGSSCAEGLVSNHLSCRLSSRPKAWVQRGLSQMAKLLEYRLNGGDFKDLIFDPREIQEINSDSEILTASDIPEICGCKPLPGCLFAMPSQLLCEPKVSTRRLLFLSITEGRRF